MYGIVYKITNKLNGKSYVGITTKTLAERFDAHLNRANREKSAVIKGTRKSHKNFSARYINHANTEETSKSKDLETP
jgi:hypothetical protein